jgi:hypothetical protein
MTDYKADLNRRYWKYQESRFPNVQRWFERPYAQDGRPPVFLASEAWRNVIINPINPNANQQNVDRLLALVPSSDRHKWYGSMNSSQALAQSILGNLAIHGLWHCLAEVQDDEGLPLVPSKGQVLSESFAMEHKIDYLGEPRRTSLDARNPAFQEKGKGFTAYMETRLALREPAMLRKCSWQRIVEHIAHERLLPWLTEHLALKYGLGL